MKILFRRNEVNPNHLFESCQTPLGWAASNRREREVKIMLTWNDINPNQPDKYDRTQLWYVAENKHWKVVEMRLGRHDIDVNKPSESGEALLLRADASGVDEIGRAHV